MKRKTLEHLIHEDMRYKTISVLYSLFFFSVLSPCLMKIFAANITPSSTPPSMSSSTQIKLDSCAIYHSDSSFTVLVTLMLIEDNYGSWSCIVRKTFRAKSKLGVVDKSLSIPKETDDISNWK
ncbi:Retrotransposon Copia-like, N-terminal [Dillenia turbinata]|uniref:Retrotransposon Copia-like, N-terminal n=1 Tax=Dillenia turbinata TaxID=194707 RepID=A0AAN8Z3W0_9MAGN